MRVRTRTAASRRRSVARSGAAVELRWTWEWAATRAKYVAGPDREGGKQGGRGLSSAAAPAKRPAWSPDTRLITSIHPYRRRVCLVPNRNAWRGSGVAVPLSSEDAGVAEWETRGA